MRKLEFIDVEGHIPCDKCVEFEKENQDLRSDLKLLIINKPTPGEYTDILNKYFWELV